MPLGRAEWPDCSVGPRKAHGVLPALPMHHFGAGRVVSHSRLQCHVVYATCLSIDVISGGMEVMGEAADS